MTRRTDICSGGDYGGEGKRATVGEDSVLTDETGSAATRMGDGGPAGMVSSTEEARPRPGRRPARLDGKGKAMAISDLQLGPETLLGETPLLDYSHPRIAALVESRGWDHLDRAEFLEAVYEYVRDEIPFGYNREETIPASHVLAEGFGQCNTKGTLLMALLRRRGVECRLHAFTVDKRLQAGLMPSSLYGRLPDSILHSWVEVLLADRWLKLEGFILDTALLSRIQARFSSWEGSFCGFAVACDDLRDPPIAWTGGDTYIQHRAINGDLGVYGSPDAFYAEHRSNVSGVKGFFWRRLYYRPTNRKVETVRAGRFEDRAERYVTACPEVAS
jgi:hypothetical protein